MSIFPHFCYDCGHLFWKGGHESGGLGYIHYHCDECFEKYNKEQIARGFPPVYATEDEFREYAKRVDRENRAKYLKELEEEERIKARVWAEALT